MTIWTILVGLLLVVSSLASLWYFVKTLIIMGKDSVLIAILAMLFSPIVHIVWYLAKRDQLQPMERRHFKRFFISFVMMFIASVAFSYLYFTMNTTTTVSTLTTV